MSNTFISRDFFSGSFRQHHWLAPTCLKVRDCRFWVEKKTCETIQTPNNRKTLSVGKHICTCQIFVASWSPKPLCSWSCEVATYAASSSFLHEQHPAIMVKLMALVNFHRPDIICITQVSIHMLTILNFEPWLWNVLMYSMFSILMCCPGPGTSERSEITKPWRLAKSSQRETGPSDVKPILKRFQSTTSSHDPSVNLKFPNPCRPDYSKGLADPTF